MSWGAAPPLLRPAVRAVEQGQPSSRAAVRGAGRSAAPQPPPAWRLVKEPRCRAGQSWEAREFNSEGRTGPRFSSCSYAQACRARSVTWLPLLPPLAPPPCLNKSSTASHGPVDWTTLRIVIAIVHRECGREDSWAWAWFSNPHSWVAQSICLGVGGALKDSLPKGKGLSRLPRSGSSLAHYTYFCLAVFRPLGLPDAHHVRPGRAVLRTQSTGPAPLVPPFSALAMALAALVVILCIPAFCAAQSLAIPERWRVRPTNAWCRLPSTNQTAEPCVYCHSCGADKCRSKNHQLDLPERHPPAKWLYSYAVSLVFVRSPLCAETNDARLGPV
jgi:hypothetical protein